VCLRPLPIMAVAEPPGRLHSSTGSPCESKMIFYKQLRTSAPDDSGAFSVTDRAAISQANLVPSRPFKPRGFRTSHEPRYVITTNRGRRHSAAASYGKLQPLTAPGGSEPPDGDSLRNPTTVVPPRCRRELSLAWAR